MSKANGEPGHRLAAVVRYSACRPFQPAIFLTFKELIDLIVQTKLIVTNRGAPYFKLYSAILNQHAL